MALNIGNINFGVDANTVGLQKAIKKISEFQKKTDQAARSQEKGTRRNAQAMVAQEKSIRQALRTTLDLQRAQRKSGQSANEIGRVTQSFQALVTQIGKAKVGSVQHTRAVQDFNDKINRSRASLAKFNAEANKGTGGLGEWVVKLRNLESSAVLALGPLSGVGARIRSLSAIFSRSSLKLALWSAGIAGVVIGLGKLLASAITAGAAMKSINLRFEAATGSARLGAMEFQFVIKTANKLGLSMDVLSKSYSRFLAASQGTNLEGKQSRVIFEQIARGAAALKLSGNDLEGVMRAVEQIMSKGTVQAEELRGQLGDRLPGAFRIAAEAVGLTTRELNKMLKEGKVISEDFLPAFAKAVGEGLGAKAEKNVNTLSGQFNILGNNTKLLLADIDDFTGASAAATSIVGQLGWIVGKLAGEQDFLAESLKVTNAELEATPTPKRIFDLTEVYTDLTKEIDEASDALKINNEALGFFGRASDDIEHLVDFFTALQKTEKANSDELEKMAERASFLLDLPIEASAEGIAAAFAEWAVMTRETNEEIQRLTDAPGILMEVNEELEGMRQRVVALSQGPDAAAIFDDITQPAQEFAKILLDTTLTMAQRNQKLAEYKALLAATVLLEDQNTEALKAQKAAIQAAERARQKMVKGLIQAQQAIFVIAEKNKAMAKGPESFEFFEKVLEPLIKFRQKLEEAGVAQETITALSKDYQDELEKQFQLTDKWARAAETAANAVVNGLEGIILKGGSVKNMLHDLAQELLKVAIRAVFLDRLTSLLGGFFKGGGFGAPLPPPGKGGGGGGGPTFASGGSIKLGGSGGSDSVPFFGMGKPGEVVGVTRPDQMAGAGGGGFTINQTNIFENATPDPGLMIPLLEENNRRLKSEILDGIDRGTFG